MTIAFNRRALFAASLLACLIGLSASCANDADTQDDRGFTAKSRVLRGADRYSNEGLIIVKADLNRDKIPDVYSVFKELPKEEDGEEAERRLVRKEIDVNFDGSIDIWRHYDKAEKLVKEELDYNFDGRVDAINHFDRGRLVRKELDVEFDQAPDVFKFYKNSKLVRVERDTNNDGEIDYWEYYEGGSLDRIGRDQDGDGRVDTWKER